VIIDLDRVLKKLMQSGPHDPQMVDCRNLLLRRRRRQRVLTQLTPHAKIILPICADRFPMAAQRVVLQPKFRCYRLQLGPISQQLLDAQEIQLAGAARPANRAPGTAPLVVPQMHQTTHHHLTSYLCSTAPWPAVAIKLRQLPTVDRTIFNRMFPIRSLENICETPRADKTHPHCAGGEAQSRAL
jgi:hypothetical protein